MEGHLLVYMLTAAGKLAVTPGEGFQRVPGHRRVGTVHTVAEEKQRWPDDGLAKLNIFYSFLSFFVVAINNNAHCHNRIAPSWEADVPLYLFTIRGARK